MINEIKTLGNASNMRKVLFFLIIFGIVFVGCYEGDIECSSSDHYVSLDVFTTDNIDSIHFYINKKQVCYGNVGTYHEMIICDDTLATGYMVAVNDVENANKCVGTEKIIWRVFHCFVGGIPGVDDDNAGVLDLELFDSVNKMHINFSRITLGGLYVNIIPEKDTTKWFGYTDNPVRPFFSEFNAPSVSTRMGCYNGYCIATSPMTERDVCCDK
jgi:hypothetical protein